MKNTKTVRRTLIAALAAIGLAGGTLAYAFPGEGHCGPQGAGMESMRGAPGQFAEKRLEKLHTDLKLAPEQEGAWKAWSDPIRQHAATMGDRHKEHEAMRTLPAPERMEKMLERMKEHQKHMEAQLATTKTFYGQLNAEQKKVFDNFHPFGGPRGGRGGHRGAPAQPQSRG